MTAENKRTFLRIVKKIPSQAVRSYELLQLLKDYEKTREQQIRELGENGQAALEARTAHELAEELVERVRRGEPP